MYIHQRREETINPNYCRNKKKDYFFWIYVHYVQQNYGQRFQYYKMTLEGEVGTKMQRSEA